MSGPQALPGSRLVRWRDGPQVWVPVAILAAVAWPPLVLSLIVLPPARMDLLAGPDWRFVALAMGLVVVPVMLVRMARGREATGQPSTRLGIIWRFAVEGLVLSALAQLVVAVLLTIIGWFGADSLGQALGAAETSFLLYGVGMLPFTMAVGGAYAIWAGWVVAMIAFKPTPPPLRVPARLLGEPASSDGAV